MKKHISFLLVLSLLCTPSAQLSASGFWDLCGYGRYSLYNHWCYDEIKTFIPKLLSVTVTDIPGSSLVTDGIETSIPKLADTAVLSVAALGVCFLAYWGLSKWFSREAEKKIKENSKNERLEKERLEKERLEKERLEKERFDKEKFDNERLENERLGSVNEILSDPY